MKDLLLVAHLLTTVARVIGPGRARAFVADSVFIKQRLLIIDRSRRRDPSLTPIDDALFSLWSQLPKPNRIQRVAVDDSSLLAEGDS
jgi:hypothetical protein